MFSSSVDNRAVYGRVKPPTLAGSKKAHDSVPTWHKYALTVDEAAKYFSIGENRLRTMVANNPTADYILRKGENILLKRELLERYFNSIHAV